MVKDTLSDDTDDVSEHELCEQYETVREQEDQKTK